jgi:hypothetical protein
MWDKSNKKDGRIENNGKAINKKSTCMSSNKKTTLNIKIKTL